MAVGGGSRNVRVGAMPAVGMRPRAARLSIEDRGVGQT